MFASNSNKSGSNLAVRTFIGQSAEQVDLRLYHNWYSTDILTYLTHLLPPYLDIFRYVFVRDPLDEEQSYYKQFIGLCHLSEQLEKYICFIATESPTSQNHFIFGVICNSNILIINPIGITKHKDFYQCIKTIEFHGKLKKIYYSKTILQKDKEGLVSCGPICAELMQHISNLSLSEILQHFDAWGTMPSNEIDITGLLPESLKGFNEVTYQDITIKLREKHLNFLQQCPGDSLEIQDEQLQTCLSCSEQTLMFEMPNIECSSTEEIVYIIPYSLRSNEKYEMLYLKSRYLQAIRDGNEALVNNLLDKNISLLNVLSLNGYTPLMLAILKGKKEIVEYLLRSGAAIDAGVSPYVDAIEFAKGLWKQELALTIKTYKEKQSMPMLTQGNSCVIDDAKLAQELQDKELAEMLQSLATAENLQHGKQIVTTASTKVVNDPELKLSDDLFVLQKDLLEKPPQEIQLVLTAQLGKSVQANSDFYKLEKMPGDNACAFHALLYGTLDMAGPGKDGKVLRIAAIEQLLEAIKHHPKAEEVKRLLAGEFKSLFIENRYLHKIDDTVKQDAIQYLEEEKRALNNYNEAITTIKRKVSPDVAFPILEKIDIESTYNHIYGRADVEQADKETIHQVFAALKQSQKDTEDFFKQHCQMFVNQCVADSGYWLGAKPESPGVLGALAVINCIGFRIYEQEVLENPVNGGLLNTLEITCKFIPARVSPALVKELFLNISSIESQARVIVTSYHADGAVDKFQDGDPVLVKTRGIHFDVIHKVNVPDNLPELRILRSVPYKKLKTQNNVPTLEGDGNHQASGIKRGLHGTIYQLKLLMLFLKRGLKSTHSFSLATEMDVAEKFDDVVFRYSLKEQVQQWKYRFLQAKHKLEGKITDHDLLTEKDDEFSLQKYFISYQKIKKQFKDGILENFTICTNINFDFEGDKKTKRLLKLESTFDIIKKIDDILNVGGKNPAMHYRFKKDFPGKDKLYEVLYRTSDTIRLANKFVKCVLKKIKLDLKEPIFSLYHKALATEVIETQVGIRLVNHKINESLEMAVKNGKEILIVKKDNDQFEIFYRNKNGKKEKDNKVNSFMLTKQELLKILLSLDFKEEILANHQNAELYKLIYEEVISNKGDVRLQDTKLRSSFVKGDASLSCQAKNFREQFIKNALLIEKFNDEAALWDKINEQWLQWSSTFGKTLKLSDNPRILNLEKFVHEIVNLLIEANDSGFFDVKIERRKEVIKNNIDSLVGYILVITDDENIQFSKAFLQGDDLPGDLQEFRSLLEKQLEKTNISFDELEKFQFSINNFQTCEEDQLRTQPVLPADIISDEEIEDFLDRLVFAVYQPNETELGEIINNEIGTEFNLIDSDFVVSQFQKEMLDWMKKKEGRFLRNEHGEAFFIQARQKVDKLILIGPTLEYRAKLDRSKIVFKESINLQKFLESDRQLLNFITLQSTWLGSLKIYKSLSIISDYKRDGSYIFIRLESCLNLEESLLSGFSDPKCNLLIIECNTEFKGREIEELFNKLKYILSENAIKKIILITKKDTYLNIFKAEIKCLSIEDKDNDFNNLDPNSQAVLKSKMVIFQGQKTNFSELINDEDFNKVVNSAALVDLINIENIVVDNIQPQLTDFESACYIDRKLNRKVALKPECLRTHSSDLFAISGVNAADYLKSLLPETEKTRIFEEEDPEDSHPIRYILLTEKKEVVEFNQLCAHYTKRSVHWLEINDNSIIWKQSYGGLTELRQYVIQNRVEEYKPHEVNDRIVVIVAEPGMGKTIELIHLVQEVKAISPKLWIIKIDLKKYEVYLNNIHFDTKEDVIDFLAKIRQLTIVAINLLKVQLENQEKIALFFDGFDEISSTHQAKIIQFIKILKNQTKIGKILVATRPHMKLELEDAFGVFAYNLKQFSEVNIEEFLKKFWLESLGLPNKKAINGIRLSVYAKALVKVFSASIVDEKLDFMGIPLQAKLLAEVFQKDFLNFHSSVDDEPRLPEHIEILDLYQRFKECKYNIYLKEKINIDDYLSRGLKDSLLQSLTKAHWRLALDVLFPGQTTEFFKDKELTSFKEEELKLVGFIQFVDGKLGFTHRTFAEYFVADLLVNRLKKSNSHPSYQQAKEFLLINIFKARNYVIRTFLEYRIFKEENSKLSYKWEAICNCNLLKASSKDPKSKKKIPVIECFDELEDITTSIQGQDFPLLLERLQNFVKSTQISWNDSIEINNFLPDFFKALLEVTDMVCLEQGLEILPIIAKLTNYNKLKLTILTKIDGIIKHYINQQFYQARNSGIKINYELLAKFAGISICSNTSWLGQEIGSQVETELKKYKERLNVYKQLEQLVKNPPQITERFLGALTEVKILFLRIVYNITFNSNQVEYLKKSYDSWHANDNFKELFLKVDETEQQNIKNFLIEKKEYELILKLFDKFRLLKLTESDISNIYNNKDLFWLERTGIKVCFSLKTLTSQMTRAFILPLKADKVNGYHTGYAYNVLNGLLFPLLELEREWQNNMPYINRIYFFKLLACFIEFSLKYEVNISLSFKQLEIVLKLIQTVLNKSVLSNRALSLSVKSVITILKAVDFRLIDIGSELLVLDPISEFQFKLSLNHKSIIMKLIIYQQKPEEDFEEMCSKAAAELIQDSLLDGLNPALLASPQLAARDDSFIGLNTRTNQALLFSYYSEAFNKNFKRFRSSYTSPGDQEGSPKRLKMENLMLRENNKKLFHEFRQLTIQLKDYKQKNRKRQLDTSLPIPISEEKIIEPNSPKKKNY